MVIARRITGDELSSPLGTEVSPEADPKEYKSLCVIAVTIELYKKSSQRSIFPA